MRIRKHRSWYGDHRFIYLANTVKELELFQENGIQAVFCNQNAFLDAAIFFPIRGSKKRFRAIYDAAFIPYKRHYLARQVSDLALTAYVKNDTGKADISAVKASLPHAVWLKDGSATGNAWLSDRDINGFLNEARVGLCLSAAEGAMYASAQYLLAGLPVVTTHSRGGRDVFFDSDFVRYVADDPAAVVQAVDELCAAPPDPDRVRALTLARFAEHRGRFVELLNSIYRAEGRGDVWAESWPAQLPNKLHNGDISIMANVAALVGKRGGPPWQVPA
jgi:glycosyltransferase involved in cell wall biosynthesis